MILHIPKIDEDAPDIASTPPFRGTRHTSPRSRRSAAAVGRRHAARITHEALLSRAEYLPAVPRALISARFALGMSLEELATLHHLTVRQARRRLDHLCDTLADPCFLMAARFGQHLPAELAAVARDYWIEGRTLREMATGRGKTLHRIRRDIDLARSLLVVALSREQEIPPELARAAIAGSAIRKAS